jgi:AAHS family 4-hydroxybenzoate transporter-like MFS transporter
MTPDSPRVIDIATLLDAGPWSVPQRWAVALAALAIIFDGLDNQMLGLAMPAIAAEWGLKSSQLSPVVAINLIGMGMGAAAGGVIGDRIGRRPALIGAVVGFCLLTLASAFVQNVWTLGAARFFVGFGVGAALPGAAALASELVPTRHRALAVTLTIVCVPLGGTVAGLIAAWILPAHGWRALFVIGGILPLGIGILFLFVLPESPRYLARRPQRWAELAQTLARFGHRIPASSSFVESVTLCVPDRVTSMRALLAPDVRRETLFLWGAFFSCLLAAYCGFNWIPLMLAYAGFDAATASSGLAAFNLGGVVAALATALAIPALGSRPAMLIMSAAAAVSAMGAGPLISLAGSDSPVLAIALLGMIGACINAVQTTSYALAAHVYPTALRATGVGAALALGRGGAILSAFVGAAAVESAGSSAFFLLLAIAMTANFLSLAALDRHIPAA